MCVWHCQNSEAIAGMVLVQVLLVRWCNTSRWQIRILHTDPAEIAHTRLYNKMIGWVHAELSRSGLDFVLSAGMLGWLWVKVKEQLNGFLGLSSSCLVWESCMEVDRRYTTDYFQGQQPASSSRQIKSCIFSGLSMHAYEMLWLDAHACTQNTHN